MIRLVGMGLWLLAPGWLRAQTGGFTPSALDAWRASLNERLDQSLAELSASAGNQSSSPIVLKYGREAESPPPIMPLPLLSAGKHEPWLPTVADVLRQHGLPTGLLGVAAVESSFNPRALSPKGARGLWQLMPETAKRYGLVVNAERDERLDPLKSTFAAAQYLKDLYAQFRDWPLVLAAYNAGEDRVQRSLDRLRARDFWQLSRHSALPDETRRYVPAALAKLGGSLGSFDHASLQTGNFAVSMNRALGHSSKPKAPDRVFFAMTSPRFAASADPE